MKSKIASVFSLYLWFIGAALYSYPYDIQVMYSQQKNQYIYLLSDLHTYLTQNYTPEDLERINAQKDVCEGKITDLFAQFFRYKCGNVKFIIECSEVLANYCSKELFEKALTKDESNFKLNVLPHLPVVSELAKKFNLSTEPSSYKAFLIIYLTLTQKFDARHRDHEFVKQVFYPQCQPKDAIALSTPDLLMKIAKEWSYNQYLINLANNLTANEIPDANIILSDSLRDSCNGFGKSGIIDMMQQFQLIGKIIQPLIENGAKDSDTLLENNLFKYIYIRNLYIRPFLVKILISLYSTLNTETILDKMEKQIQSEQYSQSLKHYKEELQNILDNGLSTSIHDFFGETTNIHTINKVFNFLAMNTMDRLLDAMDTPFDLEALGNILLCDKNNIIIYAGGMHCKNLCALLTKYGFNNISTTHAIAIPTIREGTIIMEHIPNPVDPNIVAQCLFNIH